MIQLRFTNKQYELVCKYVPEIKWFQTNMTIVDNFVYLEMTEMNFDEFEDAYNFSIVPNGMDNQDTVNAIGIRLYQIYDECIL